MRLHRLFLSDELAEMLRTLRYSAWQKLFFIFIFFPSARAAAGGGCVNYLAEIVKLPPISEPIFLPKPFGIDFPP